MCEGGKRASSQSEFFCSSVMRVYATANHDAIGASQIVSMQSILMALSEPSSNKIHSTRKADRLNLGKNKARMETESRSLYHQTVLFSKKRLEKSQENMT